MSCKPFANCFDFIEDKRQIVTCSDKKSLAIYTYKNSRSAKLSKYRIDGCLINDNGAKCDFLLLNCDHNKSYFIELKGSDLSRAVDQIDRSVELLKGALSGYSINARIVVTRINTIDLKSTKYLRLEKKLNYLKGDLKKGSRQMTESN